MTEPRHSELPERPTRGHGLLEPWLARLRARKANQLISGELRNGKVLDIGCGTSPYFLANTSFQERFGIDRVGETRTCGEVRLRHLDLNNFDTLPFPDESFNVVTMLAVVEHLDPGRVAQLFRESGRLLIPGGMVIVTTPASWTDGLLHFLGRCQLVSQEEVAEHQYAYSLPVLGWYFGQAGFEMNKIRFGYFEAYMNMWATAVK